MFQGRRHEDDRGDASSGWGRLAVRPSRAPIQRGESVSQREHARPCLWERRWRRGRDALFDPRGSILGFVRVLEGPPAGLPDPTGGHPRDHLLPERSYAGTTGGLLRAADGGLSHHPDPTLPHGARAAGAGGRPGLSPAILSGRDRVPRECRASAAMAASAQFALWASTAPRRPRLERRPWRRGSSRSAIPGPLRLPRRRRVSRFHLPLFGQNLADAGQPADFVCPAGEDCAGLAATARWTTVKGPFGRTASGIDSHVTNAFREAYRRLRPLLGAPGCPAPPVAPVQCPVALATGGGPLPRTPICSIGGTLGQRFYQPGQPERVSAVDAVSALVLNRRLGRAESLRWPFLQLYRCLRRGALRTRARRAGAAAG